MTAGPVQVVRRWIAAMDAQDADALAALADPDVRLTTPRGELTGHDGVRELIRRQTFGVALHPKPLRAFHRGGEIVVTEDELEFRSADDGSVMGRERAAALFRVRAGRVVAFTPFEQLAAALAEAGLDEGDEVA